MIICTILCSQTMLAKLNKQIKERAVIDNKENPPFYTLKTSVSASIVMLIIGMSLTEPIEKTIQTEPKLTTSKNQVETKKKPVAHKYTVIDFTDYSFPGRTRLEWTIMAPTAITAKDRARTAMQAAKDLQEEYQSDVSFILLEDNEVVAGKGFPYAMAAYCYDVCGMSGQDCNGVEFKIKTSDIVLTEQQREIWKSWYTNLNRFKYNGTLNEGELTEYLAKKFNVEKEYIKPPFINRVSIDSNIL